MPLYIQVILQQSYPNITITDLAWPKIGQQDKPILETSINVLLLLVPLFTAFFVAHNMWYYCIK